MYPYCYVAKQHVAAASALCCNSQGGMARALSAPPIGGEANTSHVIRFEYDVTRVVKPVGSHAVPDAVAADVAKSSWPAFRGVDDGSARAI
jgi:hypothetical protein